MTDNKRTLIRNSTAEFPIFTTQSGEQGIEASYEDESLWLMQKLMAIATTPTFTTWVAAK